NFVEAIDELLGIDLEDGLQWRKLLEQSPPLVQAPHSLHQEALRGGGNDVLAIDGAELHLEGARAPDQGAINGFLAQEAAELRIHHLAVAEVDDGGHAVVLDTSYPALAPDLEGLEQVHHPHVLETAAEARTAAA